MVAPFSTWMKDPISFAFLRIGTVLTSRAGIHHNKEAPRQLIPGGREK